MALHPELGIAAFRLAEVERAFKRGWIFTPLNGKKPVLKDWTKRPAPTLDEVRAWARIGNVGLRTGSISGVFVLDVDPSKGGGTRGLDLPPTPTVLTGGGGAHYYFSLPTDHLGNSASRIALGVDTRGEGGQVVFVGSIHPDTGRPYTWAPALSPDDVPLAALPISIAFRLRTPPPRASRATALPLSKGTGYAQAALFDEVARVTSAIPGTRNQTLNISAFNLGQLVASGVLNEEEVLVSLLQAAREAGLDEEEAMPTIRSGLDAGRNHPRNTTGVPKSSMKPNQVVRFEKNRSSSEPNVSGSGGGQAASLPTIDAYDGNLPHMAREAWDAVQRANTPPHFFRYADLPSRVQRDDNKMLVVRELNKDRLRYHLARVATWYKLTRQGVKEVHPPMAAVRDMLATPEPPLPILTRIVEAPIFAPDGTLCTDPGYSPASQTYYAPAKGFVVPPVSQVPTSEEVDRARSLLLDDLLVDFPFTGDAERANAVALALLPFVRDLIEGVTPLHLFEKPSPGTGGTLLVEVLLYPALGHAVATMTEGREEEEWRKRLTAKLMQGPAAILIDNLRNPLESSAVAAAITSPIWEDRILGFSQIARVRVGCAWAATGNNPILSGEIARRSIRCRLDAMMDQPWRREKFKHPKLLKWTREHRGDLTWSLLTLAQAWISAGSPHPPQAKSLGMFEEWARVVGGILAHSRIDGFLGNLDQFYTDSDTEGSALRTFVAVWYDRFHDQPVGVADLLPVVVENDLFDLGDGTERSQRTRLGKLIGKQRDRQFGDYHLVAAGESKGSNRWRLELAKPGATAPPSAPK
jgi:hypothetical protein